MSAWPYRQKQIPAGFGPCRANYMSKHLSPNGRQNLSSLEDGPSEAHGQGILLMVPRLALPSASVKQKSYPSRETDKSTYEASHGVRPGTMPRAARPASSRPSDHNRETSSALDTFAHKGTNRAHSASLKESPVLFPVRPHTSRPITGSGAQSRPVMNHRPRVERPSTSHHPISSCLAKTISHHPKRTQHPTSGRHQVNHSKSAQSFHEGAHADIDSDNQGQGGGSSRPVTARPVSAGDTQHQSPERGLNGKIRRNIKPFCEIDKGIKIQADPRWHGLFAAARKDLKQVRFQSLFVNPHHDVSSCFTVKLSDL